MVGRVGASLKEVHLKEVHPEEWRAVIHTRWANPAVCRLPSLLLRCWSVLAVRAQAAAL